MSWYHCFDLIRRNFRFIPYHSVVNTTMASAKEFVLDVIEMYKERPPCLWQVSNSDYRDKTMRNVALEEIAEFFRTKDPGANKQTVLKKINSLRSCFQKERNKVKQSMRSGVGADEVHVPKLWYYDSLLFLEDQDNPRESQTVVSILDTFPFGPENDELEAAMECQGPSQTSHASSTGSFKRPKSKSDQLLEKISQKIDEQPVKERASPGLWGQRGGDFAGDACRNGPFGKKTNRRCPFSGRNGPFENQYTARNTGRHRHRRLKYWCSELSILFCRGPGPEEVDFL